MKAWRSAFRTANEKKRACDELYCEWRKIEAEGKRKMAQRCLKIFLFVLHRDYGFGKKRLTDFYNACGALLATADTNVVFWEQIDRSIVDELGFTELGRDYTERGKAVREGEHVT